MYKVFNFGYYAGVDITTSLKETTKKIEQKTDRIFENVGIEKEFYKQCKKLLLYIIDDKIYDGYSKIIFEVTPFRICITIVDKIGAEAAFIELSVNNCIYNDLDQFIYNDLIERKLKCIIKYTKEYRH